MQSETNPSIASFDTALAPILKAWVSGLTGVILIGLAASFFRAAYAGAWAGACWMIICLAWQLKHCGVFLSQMRFAPIVLLITLGLVSWLSGLHAFLDSLTARIPQMLLLLQEGRPTLYPYADGRINSLPFIWSFISAPFYVTLGERALALPSWISFIIFWGLLMAFATKYANREKAPWLSLIIISSPVFVFQSASTDSSLFAACMILAGYYFIACRPVSLPTIVWSGLSLALAAGAKPQFCLLGLPWLIWVTRNRRFVKRSQRWRALWIFPLLFAVSPLPGLLWAYTTSSGSSNAFDIISWSPLAMLGRGVKSMILFCCQLFALPINPLAEKLNMGWSSPFGPLQLSNHVIVYPDTASLGIFSSLGLVVGLLLGKNKLPKDQYAVYWGLGLMVVGFMMTGAQTIGRSFVGFVVLVFPLALSGLALVNANLLKFWGCAALASSTILMILNPHKPLFPVSKVENWAATRASAPMLNQLVKYGQFQQRLIAGESILEALPEDTMVFGAIVQPPTPLHRFWAEKRHRKVIFLPPDVSKEMLRHYDVHHLIVRHNALTENNLIKDSFLERVNGKIINSGLYVTMLQKGPEPWFLISLE